ncbi:MAG TPA: UDP-N-acetylmuramate dehydrogenase [Myxococcaceae bacterium]|nr:UDP-N-acetylmuramate dehydrogenase [Myxococcaceae bacterium]
MTAHSTPPTPAGLLAGLAADASPGEALAPWTSLRVGGPAELLVRPRSADALVVVLARARAEGVPVHVLGGGANTLVGDLGVPGITLKLPADLFPEEVQPAGVGGGGGLVTLGAGASIVRLVNVMRARGWVGAEFLAGIPGTIGGAVAMNAGTKQGECKRVLDAVELATPDGTGWIGASALTIRYRHTELPVGAVLTRARFRLLEGDVDASRAAMEADLGYRKRTQPLSQPNCGSIFQNPPGDHAGRLVESVGLKGAVLGGAQISTLHANWIVNLGGAHAADVVGLIERAQARVREATGIGLVPEVKRVGVFG